MLNYDQQGTVKWTSGRGIIDMGQVPSHFRFRRLTWISGSVKNE